MAACYVASPTARTIPPYLVELQREKWTFLFAPNTQAPIHERQARRGSVSLEGCKHDISPGGVDEAGRRGGGR